MMLEKNKKSEKKCSKNKKPTNLLSPINSTIKQGKVRERERKNTQIVTSQLRKSKSKLKTNQLIQTLLRSYKQIQR